MSRQRLEHSARMTSRLLLRSQDNKLSWLPGARLRRMTQQSHFCGSVTVGKTSNALIRTGSFSFTTLFRIITYAICSLKGINPMGASEIIECHSGPSRLLGLWTGC